MQFALWTLGSLALFVWYGWCSLRYWVACRKSLDRDLVPGVSELLDSYFVEGLQRQFGRQADPILESLRRRMWLSIALLVGYVILSRAVWKALLG